MVKSKSYTLRNEQGYWLAQVVITDDGMFSSVSDYGNLSFAWRGFGEDFRRFLSSINYEYMGAKLASGLSYIAHGKKVHEACERFAKHILPPLQEVLKKELEEGLPF